MNSQINLNSIQFNAIFILNITLVDKQINEFDMKSQINLNWIELNANELTWVDNGINRFHIFI